MVAHEMQPSGFLWCSYPILTSSGSIKEQTNDNVESSCELIIRFPLTIQDNANYTQWSEWSECSVTCGVGEQKRSRTCTNPPPGPGRKNCEEEHLGPADETQKCRLKPCRKWIRTRQELNDRNIPLLGVCIWYFYSMKCCFYRLLAFPLSRQKSSARIKKHWLRKKLTSARLPRLKEHLYIDFE